MAAKVKSYEDFAIEKLLKYGGLDCIVTSELLTAIFPRVAEKPLYLKSNRGKLTRTKTMSILESMEEFEMPAHEFIIDLELNGIGYKVDQNRAMNSRMIAEIAELEDRIFTAIGKRIELDSGKSREEFVYGELGLEPLSFTKKGEPATDGDALLELAQKHNIEYLKWIAKRNDIASVHRTFIKDYLEHVRYDGRVHPSYNLFGTSSFRISSNDPNLTQLPRDKHGYSVRSCFGVNEGNFFLAFDFSSAEVKVLGALCKDPTLLKAIAEGKDFHSVSASTIHGIPYDEFVAVLHEGDAIKQAGGTPPKEYKIYKQWRQDAKSVTFGVLYGSSVAGVAAGLGISKEEGQKLIDLYFKAYPMIEAYIKDSHNMAMMNHFVVTDFGQRKQEFGTYDMFKKSAVYNAALRNAQNYRVQSTTSTLGLVTFSELNKAIKKLGGMCTATIYDSIEMEVPIAKASEAVETAFYYMDDYPVERFDWLDLPIGCEGELAYDWSGLKHIDRGITQEEILKVLATCSK